MKQEWKDKPLRFKLVTIASLITSISIIVLAILQLFDVWSDAGYIYVPLMGIHLLLQANMQWKPNRGVAVFSLCSGFAVLACAIVVYILKWLEF